jgi:chaperonin GroES
MSTATNPFQTRTERTSSFQKSEAPEPKLLKGKPLGTQLLVRKVEFKDTGLLVTPEMARRDTGECIVLAIGTAVQEIKVGDSILVRKYSGAGTEVTHDGATYLVLDSNEVLLILASDA